MSDTKQPNRIREVRRSRGMTMEQLGDAVGVHFTTIAKLERSMRAVSLDVLVRIAEVLGVAPADLMGSGAGAPRPVRMVPLLGKIAAGNWREAILDPVSYVPLPANAGPNAFALKPDGDSMDKIVVEGGYVVVDPDDFELRDGKIYAVMNGGGETTFKQFRANPPRLEPCSTNPIHQPIMLGREPFTVVGRIVWQGSEL